VYVGSEESVKSIEALLEDIIKIDMKGIKSLKKSDQAPVLDSIKEKLLSINFESHYDMQQQLKEGFSDTKVITTPVYKTSLQDVIDEYNKEDGAFDSTPEDDYEIFIECLSKGIVFEEITDERRWYSVQKVIHQVEIDGNTRYFETFSYYVTGDNHWSDMGLDAPTLSNVTEVFPQEVLTTVYK
jgi:hypothetical protein